MNAITRLAVAATIAVAGFATQTTASAAPVAKVAIASSYVAANDGTPLYVKDWGPRNGAVVVFSHGLSLIHI